MISVTRPALPGPSFDIFTLACIAIQAAEEMPFKGEDYPELMDAIIAECEARKTNCYLQHARSQGVTVVPPPNRGRK